MKKTLRIANAGGYWGDDPGALRRQVRGSLPVDVVVIDYLAEVTMSILQKQKAKDPRAGYARDFLVQVRPLLKELLARRIRIVTNAGGVNPRACAEALAELAREQGLELRIAVVEGDDLLARMPRLRAEADFRNLETGETFDRVASRVVAANAYFGARPVAEALKDEPDVVIGGRLTDTGLTLGPLMHAFGWAADDWNRLAAGIVAGHLVECGAQATGGNFTDWEKVPSFAELGYPILECRDDGSFTLTKHPGSGGLVTCQTVREQLLYEMGDPRSYLTPDVIADFSTVQLEQDGLDRVRLSGVKGRPPTDLLKVSIATQDGFKASGTLLVSGPDVRAKAKAFTELFLERCGAELAAQGLGDFEATLAERAGDDAAHRGLTPSHQPTEVLLRLSARARERASLEVFRKVLPSLILSGPPGVAVTGGAPALSEVVGYWPALMPRHLAPARVLLLEERGTGELEVVRVREVPWGPDGGDPATPAPPEDPWPAVPSTGPLRRGPLMLLAHARSGDKGDTANIGLAGRSPQCYAWLREHITAAQVEAWFRGISLGPVERHCVPNLWALNFLLGAALGGGGTRSLLLDAQGKTLSQALLRCDVEFPVALLETIRPEDQATSGELAC